MQYVAIKSFANNEIRVSRYSQPVKRRQVGDSSCKKEDERVASLMQEAYSTDVVKGFNAFVAINAVNRPRFELVRKCDADGIIRRRGEAKKNLDIIHEFQRAKRAVKKKRRIRGFTPYARRTLLEAGAVTERWTKSPNRNVLVTLTLPGDNSDTRDRFPQFAGYVVNRLLQVIRRIRQNVVWFFAWELQGRGVLHLHMALSSPESGVALRAGHRVKEVWERVIKELSANGKLDTCSNAKRGLCWLPQYWQNRVEVCRKSLGAYLSKYISKQKSKPGFSEDKTSTHVSLGQWWGISRRLLGMVKRCRCSVRFPVAGAAQADAVHALLKRAVVCNLPVMVYEKAFDVKNLKGRTIVEGNHFIAYMQTQDYECTRREVLTDCIHAIQDYVSIASMQGHVASMHEVLFGS